MSPAISVVGMALSVVSPNPKAYCPLYPHTYAFLASERAVTWYPPAETSVILSSGPTLFSFIACLATFIPWLAAELPVFFPPVPASP